MATTFVVFNKADVPADTLSAMVAGVRCQLAKDFCPAWGLDGSTVRVGDLSEEAELDTVQGEIGVSVFKNPDVANAGGYHDKDAQGRAYCKVFTEPYLDNGGSWTSGSNSVSVAFSHEILEPLRDPNASNWCLMSDGRLTADEVCDAVEDGFYSSEGVSVSNFLLPAWSDEGNPGPFDFLHVLTAPFTKSVGGYWLVTDASGDVQTEFGSMPQWKRDLKLSSKRFQMRAWLSQLSVFDPETAKLDPIKHRMKPRMLYQLARQAGITTFERPPILGGRKITNIVGQPVVQNVGKPVNNSGQKLGKRKW